MDIMPMLENVLQVLVYAAVTAALAFITDKVGAYYRSRTTEYQQAILAEFAGRAVMAAEQSGLAGLIADEAQAKKEFAINFMEDLLAESKIKIPVRLIANYIESAVFEYFNSRKTPAQSP